MSIVETNYFKVDIEYIQKSSLLVSARGLDEAKTIVINNVEDNVQGFKIVEARELDDTEKAAVLARMQGQPVEDEAEPARTLN